MKNPVFIVIAGLLAATPCFALKVPTPGPDDSRIRFIEYSPTEVVKIVGHYGFSTHIQLGPTEKITHIAFGDQGAWKETVINDNHLFLKPVAEEPETNMTVVSSKRVYHFELDAHWSNGGSHPAPNDMLFGVAFKYPEEETQYSIAKYEAEKLSKLLNPEESPNKANWNYWAKGSDSLKPIETFDDGRFTYITFDPNKEMPAVFIVNPDGTESLVNTNINPQHPNTIIVHSLSKQFVVRKGNRALCIINLGNKSQTLDENDGTTLKGVERKIKGIKK